MADEIQIGIGEALGTTENMPAKITSERWTKWKAENPSEYDRLKATLPHPNAADNLDSLQALVTAAEAIPKAIATAKQAYDTAVDTYNTAMAIIDGGATKALAESKNLIPNAIKSAKDSIKTAYATMKQKIVDAFNQKVPISTRLKD